MLLIIDNTDVSRFIARQGIKWQKNDVDGKNAGRSTEDAFMYRDRIGKKIRLDVTCRPLLLSEVSTLLNLLEPEYVNVTYIDPLVGGQITREMYANNRPATFQTTYSDGTDVWSGITFPLIER